MTRNSASAQKLVGMRRIALGFFLAGLLAAIALEVLWRSVGFYTNGGYVIERVARILWPSSVLKAAIQDRDSSVIVVAFYAVSFVLNGILYGFVGLVIGFSKGFLVNQRSR